MSVIKQTSPLNAIDIHQALQFQSNAEMVEG